jgi:hypothetical protein
MSLQIVADNQTDTTRIETVGARVRRLQTEAKQLAKEHVYALTEAMCAAQKMAAEISEGGDAYPAGVRDLARRFVDDCETRVLTIEAILVR